MKKFKNGDKVKILSKSYWGPLKNSNVYKKGKEQGYWYFQKYINDYGKILCIVNELNSSNSSDGDYFLENDLEFYINVISKLNWNNFKL